MAKAPTHHITHKDGHEADIALTTSQLANAQQGHDGSQKSIAIAFGHALLANGGVHERSDRKPYIEFNDLIIEDLPPTGHRD